MIIANDVQKRISEDIKKFPVLMYVKGNAQFPQCGFSKYVMGVFTELKVPFETRNVLDDPALREGIKTFTQWPTIPQIFIDGKFVGGCDIIRDLYESGELETILKRLKTSQVE